MNTIRQTLGDWRHHCAREEPRWRTTAAVAEGLPRQPRLNSRYRIVGKLGRGSVGPVCVADDTTTGSLVAIRLLPSTAARARDDDMLERTSTAIATSQAHPALVRVLETGRAANGRPFVVTEFVEGRRLSDVLASGPLAVPAALAIALELGGAVETVHNLGLVHGALRSRNVMVLADGSVKLMDLELANLRDATPRHVAPAESGDEAPLPEQVHDEVATETSDIYSFASIVYEMLCGAPPFGMPAADSPNPRKASRRLPWPRDRRRNIPRSVRRIVEAALSEQPAHRPFMSQLLNGLVVKVSVTAGARRRIALLAAAAAVAAVALGLLSRGLPTPREMAVKAPVYSTEPTASAAVQINRLTTAPARHAPTAAPLRVAAPATPRVAPTIATAPPTPVPSDDGYDPAAVIDWIVNQTDRR